MPAHSLEHGPGRGDLLAGSAVVADNLGFADQPALDCPAAPLLAGELRRRGLRVQHGAVRAGHFQHAAGVVLVHRPEDTSAATLAAALAVEGGEAGLGVVLPAGQGEDIRVAASVLAELIALACPRTVLLASPRSFCAGVERAIEVVNGALERSESTVYVRKQIVHNTHVVGDLRDRGAVFVNELDEVPDGATVVFSAHGVSPAVRADAARRKLNVIDATCPLVAKVHTEARRFAARNDTVVLIGHAGHEEVEGTLGEAPDHIVLVENVDEAARLEVPDPQRVSYMTQTTLAIDETSEIVTALRARFPALREPGSEDICYATTNRQNALRAVTSEADLVLVVGSPNSSNSLRLVELSRRQDTRAHLIESAEDIQTDWLSGTRVIGLTAGASAPPSDVEGVIRALSGLGPVAVEEREITRETMHFTLPTTVRSR